MMALFFIFVIAAVCIAIYQFGGFQQHMECSVSIDEMEAINERFKFLIELLGSETLQNVKVLQPISADFPFAAGGSKESATAVMRLLATQMNLDPDYIKLTFFRQNTHSNEEKKPVGLHRGISEDGVSTISIREDMLADADSLVAIIAHELAHVQLLDKFKLEKNDEYLTDLTTVFYGLGIFNANASIKMVQSFDAFERSSSYQYSTLGYMHETQYGYALALFAYCRGEENPTWLKYLNTNIKVFFKGNFKYISETEINLN